MSKHRYPHTRGQIRAFDVKTVPSTGMIGIVTASHSARKVATRSLVMQIYPRFDAVVFCGEYHPWIDSVPEILKCGDTDDVLETVASLPESKQLLVVVADPEDTITHRFCEWSEKANVLVVLCIRNVADLSDYLRARLCLLFFLRQTVMRQRRRIYTMFNPCFRSFNQFQNVFHICVYDFDAMALWLDGRYGTEVEDCAFCFQSENTSSFRGPEHKDGNP